MEEFSRTLRAELDYLQEARNAERFAQEFAHAARVRIPRVHGETTTSLVLTLERLSGVRIDDLEGLDAAGIDAVADLHALVLATRRHLPPLAGATFTYYQVLKKETGGSNDSQAGFSMKTLLGGPLVILVSVALRTPFDIIEQQLQLSAVGTGTSAAHAGQAQPQPFTPTPAAIRERILATWHAEGARGVWRGYPAAVGGITTYVAGYFVIYEAARRFLLQVANDLVTEHPTVSHLVAGGLGGGLTAVLATPFDCIKVRMQTKVYATAADPFPSMQHVTRETIKAAGWRGLWRGALERFTSNAPSGAIMFAVYEAGYRWLDRKLLALSADGRGRGEM